MKCFIRSYILGLKSDENANDICTTVNPIIRSLVGSVLFITLMTTVSHILRG